MNASKLAAVIGAKMGAVMSATVLLALSGCYESVDVADAGGTSGGIEGEDDDGDSGDDGSGGVELDGPGTCLETATYFREQVWAPYMSSQCYACHNPLGQAKHTDLVLRANDVPGHQETNIAMIRSLARLELDGEPLILVKARGDDNHGGGAQLDPESEDYAALADLIDQLEEGPTICADDADVLAYFQGVEMMGPEETLRRLTIALAGRLPSDLEKEMVDAAGDEAVEPIVRGIIENDPAFQARLIEIFDATLHTEKFIGGTAALDLLADADFPTKNWFDAIADEAARNTSRARSNTALAREPLELIRYIVREGRPLTEIVTANYTVANPYLAQVYGLDTSVFVDMNDQGDWQPFVIGAPPAGEEVPEGEGEGEGEVDTTYHHAGVLTTPAYLGRYPTTETSRNRLRAQKTLEFFLATDVMSLGARPLSTDAVAEHNPTLNNPQCTSCHEIMDPVAGAFLNWNDVGRFRPKESWYQDMLAPGLGAEVMPAEDYPRSLQWIGERIADDVRFSRAMVDMIFYGMTGQKALREPTDPSAPNYAAQIKAFHVQDRVFSDMADAFAASGYDFGTLVALIVNSGYYRATNVDGGIDDARRAELEPLGGVRLSSPEQFHRKVAAVTGYTWLDDNGGSLLTRGRPLHLMYGGVNSDTVLEGYTQVNGVMSNIISRMANEMACRSTTADFAVAADDRLLFPHVETSAIPGVDDDAIEANILYLHEHILGETITATDPRFEDTRFLFESVYEDGLSGIASGDYPATLIAPCQQSTHPETGDPLELPIVDDPDYTVRAWMAVVSAMLGDFNFIYE